MLSFKETAIIIIYQLLVVLNHYVFKITFMRTQINRTYSTHAAQLLFLEILVNFIIHKRDKITLSIKKFIMVLVFIILFIGGMIDAQILFDYFNILIITCVFFTYINYRLNYSHYNNVIFITTIYITSTVITYIIFNYIYY
jgi:hypothetical protein